MWKLEQHFSLRGTLPDKQPMVVDRLQKVKLWSLRAKKGREGGVQTPARPLFSRP